MSDRVMGAKRGDAGAAESLVEEHMTAVHRLVSAKLGRDNEALEDVVQEALIAAMSGIRGLRGDDEAAFLRWLLMIARHKVADHHRSRYAKAEEALSETSEGSGEAVSAEEIAVGRERDERVRAVLALLTGEQEEIITLKYILGYDNEQVAAITQRSIGAVKSMHHRALGRLAQHLEHERDE
jgi:RNA polymerase sigma-70 factor (ECF subfamily)